MDSRDATQRGPRAPTSSSDARESLSLADARKLGELEAEMVHLRLRLKESLTRELRLVERAIKAEENLENALATEHELRLQVDRYADFHRAVELSRAWRLIQFVRRIVGREW